MRKFKQSSMRDKIEGYQANVLFPTSTATQNIAQVSAKCYSRLTAVPFEFSCLATKRIPTDLDKSESSVKTLAPEFLAGKEWVSQVKTQITICDVIFFSFRYKRIRYDELFYTYEFFFLIIIYMTFYA